MSIITSYLLNFDEMQTAYLNPLEQAHFKLADLNMSQSQSCIRSKTTKSRSILSFPLGFSATTV